MVHPVIRRINDETAGPKRILNRAHPGWLVVPVKLITLDLEKLTNQPEHAAP